MNAFAPGEEKRKDALTPMDCEHCVFWIYDEEADEDFCEYDFDEDELEGFRRGSAPYAGTSATPVCPYFRLYDEYGTVRKQN